MIKSRLSFFPFAFIIIICSFSSCNKKNTLQSEIPQSIVALSPVSAEILFAIGAESQVSAVSNLTDYPPEATKKPFVGGFDGKTISIESILKYKPDLVYLTDVMHNYMIETLESYGINYYLSKADSVESVEQEILDIGKITGHLQEAENLVEGIKNKISLYSKKNENSSKLKIYYEVWQNPYMSVGSKSFMNQLISLVNAENIFSDIDESYPEVSEESIIMRQPDVILIPKSSGLTLNTIKQRRGWDSTPAFINSKIYFINDDLYNRAGPRIPEILEDLYKLLYINE